MGHPISKQHLEANVTAPDGQMAHVLLSPCLHWLCQEFSNERQVEKRVISGLIVALIYTGLLDNLGRHYRPIHNHMYKGIYPLETMKTTCFMLLSDCLDCIN